MLFAAGRATWGYRYLSNSLERNDDVDASLIPATAGEGEPALPGDAASLAEFDVVILSGALDEFDRASRLRFFKLLAAHVREAGCGLVVVAETGDSFEGPLLDLLPVEIDKHEAAESSTKPFSFRLTEAGRRLPFLQMKGAEDAGRPADALPGIYSFASVAGVKPGATVLAEHPEERDGERPATVLAERPFGAGRVLFIGTGDTWRWRADDSGGAFFDRFWLGAIARVARSRES